MVSTAKSDGHLRLRYVLPAEKHKKLKDLHLVEYNIYIYNNTNIDIYIIYQYQHIYIYIYNIYTCTSVIIRILFAIIDFTDWMGNARGGLAAHSAGASQSCGNAPWAGDRWNLVM